jgi:crossover junction endodeoxyribonuclease RuvC
MLVIGIDPGTETTGYGIVSENDAGDLNLVCYGVIKTSKEKSPARRLQKIYNELNDILLLNNPASSAVEKLFFQRNVSTAIAVGQARGVILLALNNSNLEIEEYTPNEVKQSVTGYGNADKKQVQEMVKILLGLETIPKPDDAADALAIAICHLRHQKLKALSEGNGN